MHLHGMQGLPLTGTQANGAGSGAGKGATPSLRLVRAAHEFEGQLMEELLKPMTDSDGLTGESVSDSAGALGSFASEALGQALSAQGGLGLADEIIRNLTPHGRAEVSRSETETGQNRPQRRPGNQIWQPRRVDEQQQMTGVGRGTADN